MSGPNTLNFASKVVFLNGTPITLPSFAGTPGGTPAAGDLYYDSTSNTINYYNGTSWVSVGGGTTSHVQLFTLNGTDISNGFVTLSLAPATPSGVILLVENAGNMFYGVDFTVSGSQLSWHLLGLDGILASGDNLTVTYSN